MRTPPAALWLGAAGLIPFAAASISIWIFPAQLAERATFLLVAYGAVILSFMGAVHWGLVLSPGAARAGASETRWLSLGVIPALLGWFALMLPPRSGLVLLAIAFLGVYALDRLAIATGLAPLWYGRLRLWLTAAVFAFLLLGIAAVWSRLA